MKIKSLVLVIFISFISLFASSDIKVQKENSPVVEPIISLPSGHFFENLTFLNDKEIIATDYTGMSLYKYKEGVGSSLFSKVDGHPVSIRFDDKGIGLLSVHHISILKGESFVNSMALYKVTSKGELTLLKTLDFPAFLNGMAVLDDGKFLIADALNGKIYKFDIETKELTTWFDNNILKPDPKRAGLPGVNGIQIYENTLYLTNSAKKLLAKIDIKDKKATSYEVLNKTIQADDFLIDENRNWYITTHHDEILKYTNKKEIITLLNSGVEGNTAILKSKYLKDTFYITNDGGLLFGSKQNAGLSKVKFK